MHEDLKDRVAGVFPQLVDTLERLVRIPSVSAPGFPPEAVRHSAEVVAEELRSVGFEGVRLLEVEGAHPAVYGHIAAPPGAPTVLLYAHHDVQPPGPAEQWTSGPFDPSVVAGRMYGRGVSDDKSGIIMHLGAVMAFDGALPVGVKVFVEGEEEIGSAHLDGFLARYGDLLEADVIVIGDSSNWRVGQPALTTSLRGLVAVGVEVRTAANAVHSGMYGGVFPDALMALSKLLATLHDDDGNVAVTGILHEESPPLDLTEEELRSQLGAVPGLRTLGSGSLTGRLWSKPAISVLAIDAPPLSEAINQLVPRAAAKVSMRIPPGQDPTDAMNVLRGHLIEHAPWGVDVTVTGIEAGSPFRLTTEGAAFEAWRSGMRQAWGTEPVEVGVGGSIPFVASFNGRFPQAAILLTGPGDPTSAFHAPNESQDLAELERAVFAQAVALRLLGG